MTVLGTPVNPPSTSTHFCSWSKSSKGSAHLGAVPSDSTLGKPGRHRYHEAAGPGRCETQVFQGLSKTQIETEPIVARLPDASSRGTLERTALSRRFTRPASPEKSQQKQPGSTSAPGEVCALPLSSTRSQTAQSGHTVKDPPHCPHPPSPVPPCLVRPRESDFPWPS